MPLSNSSATRYHSVVIVGAGLSGLQCANRLLSKYPDLLLVEASPRVGGRVQQVQASPLLVLEVCFRSCIWFTTLFKLICSLCKNVYVLLFL